jgi:hypothetical protein
VVLNALCTYRRLHHRPTTAGCRFKEPQNSDLPRYETLLIPIFLRQPIYPHSHRKVPSEDDTSQTEYQFNASITANFTGTADAIKKQKAKEAAANAAAATEQAQQQGGAQ